MRKVFVTLFVVWLGAQPRSEAGMQMLSPGSALAAWQLAQGWQEVGNVTLDPEDPQKFKTEKGTGVIVSTGRAAYLMTTEQYRDVEVHVEFMITTNSNSGVYFCGSHEVQIFDSFGVGKPPYPGIACGGIYPEWINGANVRGHNPLVNASLPPGEWQTFDVIYRAPRFDVDGKKTFHARFVKVLHNGKIVQENVEVLGTTRSGLAEKALGPLRLQGDHGPVAYRNIRVRKLK